MASRSLKGILRQRGGGVGEVGGGGGGGGGGGRYKTTYKECQWGDLKEQPELGLGGWGCHIGEDTLLLHNDLHSSTAPQPSTLPIAS